MAPAEASGRPSPRPLCPCPLLPLSPSPRWPSPPFPLLCFCPAPLFPATSTTSHFVHHRCLCILSSFLSPLPLLALLVTAASLCSLHLFPSVSLSPLCPLSRLSPSLAGEDVLSSPPSWGEDGGRGRGAGDGDGVRRGGRRRPRSAQRRRRRRRRGHRTQRPSAPRWCGRCSRHTSSPPPRSNRRRHPSARMQLLSSSGRPSSFTSLVCGQRGGCDGASECALPEGRRPCWQQLQSRLRRFPSRSASLTASSTVACADCGRQLSFSSCGGCSGAVICGWRERRHCVHLPGQAETAEAQRVGLVERWEEEEGAERTPLASAFRLCGCGAHRLP